MSRLKFIHLSDLHLAGRGEHPQGYDTWTNTTRALDHSLGLFPDADFIVITGDLANWGERDAYVRLKKRLDEVPIPVFLMVGNHDSRENFLSVFGDRHPYALPYIQYAQTFGDHTLLFLDSQTIGTHGGAFNRERLDWMEGQLAAADRDVLIFMHHHPVEIGAPSMDAKGIGDLSGFHRILARHRNKIRHIFHGHCHTLLQGNIEGVSFTGIRSMGEQAYTDLRTEKACRWVTDPHYAVALVTPNSVVTHVMEFNYSGPMIVRERQKFEEFVGMCADRGVTVPTADPVMHVAE